MATRKKVLNKSLLTSENLGGHGVKDIFFQEVDPRGNQVTCSICKKPIKEVFHRYLKVVKFGDLRPSVESINAHKGVCLDELDALFEEAMSGSGSRSLAFTTIHSRLALKHIR